MHESYVQVIQNICINEMQSPTLAESGFLEVLSKFANLIYLIYSLLYDISFFSNF